jgi:hypothetical protein
MTNVLIMGCGRSGTSMLAGSLHHSGYNIGGKGHNPNTGNQKGYFETKEINGINDWLLFNDSRTRFTEGSCHGWLSRFPINQHPRSNLQVETNIQYLIQSQKPFCFKDPRFSYTLPIWKKYLVDTKFICVFRNPSQVVASILENCRTAPYLSKIKIDDKICYDIWMYMYGHIISKHIDNGDWLFLEYDQILNGDGLIKTEEFLEVDIDKSFVDTKLCRAKKNTSMPTEIQNRYHVLRGLAGLRKGNS